MIFRNIIRVVVLGSYGLQYRSNTEVLERSSEYSKQRKFWFFTAPVMNPMKVTAAYNGSGTMSIVWKVGQLTGEPTYGDISLQF